MRTALDWDTPTKTEREPKSHQATHLTLNIGKNTLHWNDLIGLLGRVEVDQRESLCQGQPVVFVKRWPPPQNKGCSPWRWGFPPYNPPSVKIPDAANPKKEGGI